MRRRGATPLHQIARDDLDVLTLEDQTLAPARLHAFTEVEGGRGGGHFNLALHLAIPVAADVSHRLPDAPAARVRLARLHAGFDVAAAAFDRRPGRGDAALAGRPVLGELDPAVGGDLAPDLRIAPAGD